jgi:hypothetical protein
MIKAEQIPYEVKMRMRAVLLDGETDEAVAIAAAINVWPGGWIHQREGVTGKTLSLPLTQENNDDQG